MTRRWLATMMLFLLSGPSGAAGDAGRGAAVVDQWCRLCHQRADEARDPDMAPPYEEIVRRKGRDEAYFRRFLHEDHFPMTIYRLFEDEKEDVVAYLLDLQRREGAAGRD
jgi:Cytochrome c553